jgi:TonB family protein
MRFIGSFLGALVVVGLLLTVGVRLFEVFDEKEVGLAFHEVDLLSQAEHREFAELVGSGPRPGSLPPLTDIPPLEFRRSVQGFVQLELSVSEQGQVTDARVLGSTLPLSYHQRAVDMVRDKTYSPELIDGRPAPGRRLEIVEFRMDAPQSDPSK